MFTGLGEGAGGAVVHRLAGDESGEGGGDQPEVPLVQRPGGVGGLGRADGAVVVGVEGGAGGLHLRAVGGVEAAVDRALDLDAGLVGRGGISVIGRDACWPAPCCGPSRPLTSSVGTVMAARLTLLMIASAPIAMPMIAFTRGSRCTPAQHRPSVGWVGAHMAAGVPPERPGDAAAGGGERGDGPARVAHHARALDVDITPEPFGQLVEDRRDVSSAVGHAVGHAALRAIRVREPGRGQRRHGSGRQPVLAREHPRAASVR